jgi:hypothetical protein
MTKDETVSMTWLWEYIGDGVVELVFLSVVIFVNTTVRTPAIKEICV